jgi:disulfide bond formation protein DsbB
MQSIKFLLTPTWRQWAMAGFFFCLTLILSALVLQYQQNLDPCPLCISQRIMVIMAGLFFLVGFIHNPGKIARKLYPLATGLMALLGGAVSLRHIYIQMLPADKIPACGPSVEYMLNYFPLNETFKFMLSGTGDCAKIDWTFLGLSLPVWVLFCFVIILIACFRWFYAR